MENNRIKAHLKDCKAEQERLLTTYENYNREDKLYYYTLVKNKGKTFKIDYDIPPRSRIELGDTIYFSYGNFQLGPLKFV